MQKNMSLHVKLATLGETLIATETQAANHRTLSSIVGIPGDYHGDFK